MLKTLLTIASTGSKGLNISAFFILCFLKETFHLPHYTWIEVFRLRLYFTVDYHYHLWALITSFSDNFARLIQSESQPPHELLKSASVHWHENRELELEIKDQELDLLRCPLLRVFKHQILDVDQTLLDVRVIYFTVLLILGLEVGWLLRFVEESFNFFFSFSCFISQLLLL